MHPCCPSRDAQGGRAAYAMLGGCCRIRPPPVHRGKLTLRASALTPWGRVRPADPALSAAPEAGALRPCSLTPVEAALGSDLSCLWTWMHFPDKPQIPPNPPCRFLQDMHGLVPPPHPCPGACRTQTSQSFPKHFSPVAAGCQGVQPVEQSQAPGRKSGRRGQGQPARPRTGSGSAWGPGEHHPGVALRWAP